jgi:hypothetical protein
VLSIISLSRRGKSQNGIYRFVPIAILEIPLFPERNCNGLRALAIVALRDKITVFPEENGDFGFIRGLPDKDEVCSSSLRAPTHKARRSNGLRRAFLLLLPDIASLAVCRQSAIMPAHDDQSALRRADLAGNGRRAADV